MANTVYNYAGSQGIYSFPNAAASFQGDEATATTETPLSTTPDTSIIRDVPTTPQLSLGSEILGAAGNVASSAVSATFSPFSSFFNWIETGISDTLVRGGVVILGFIMVAAGLYAFKNTSVSVMLKK